MRLLAHHCICIAVLLATASARSADTQPTSNSIDDQSARSGGSGVFGDLRYVYQVYKDCSGSELSSCLKLKLLTAMDRVSRSVQLNIVEGITLVKDDPNTPDEQPKSAEEIEANLPRALDDREDALNTMILDKIVNFFQSHTLKLKLPNVEELQRSLTEEGRGKKKKGMGGLLAIPLLIGGTLVPLALGALALLAGKALIVSKLALVLASIIGLKKLVSNHDHGHEVVQVSGHGSSGWARSGHDLAYNAYKPPSA
ncbi:uncharacterized protein LOC127287059 [Leptopilina boulardi]|uniref:uncharacterized protein LOC127287059 n=1 Tax=Leptopilina boulardi TaxID=63433 RepID=UPI0021F6269D|nr:uncharacterized protein LOC127287059 [Leptopilina boulardi]